MPTGEWRLAHRLALEGLGAPAVASSRPHASQLRVWGALLARISDRTEAGLVAAKQGNQGSDSASGSSSSLSF